MFIIDSIRCGAGPLDEVCVRINGTTHELGRAVDHDGEGVEGVVTNRRDRRAARECPAACDDA